QATSINGNRFNSGGGEEWIKVETVVYNEATANFDTQDITQDILALGVTDAPPNTSTFTIADLNYNTNAIDSRSIIKMQRFVMAGPPLTNTNFISSAGTAPNTVNFVEPGTVATGNNCNSLSSLTAVDNGTFSGQPFFPNNFSGDSRSAMRNATISGISGVVPCVVPFPINMFDTREGLYNDST